MSSLLPPNASPLVNHLVDTTERASNQNINSISDLWNADTCALSLLPWLAWAEGVQEWSSQWSESVQRAVIKATRETRRKRGTAQAVIDAVAAFGGIAIVEEWFEKNPQGVPGTFDVTISGGGNYIDEGLQYAMIASIDRAKNVRSHYTLNVGITSLAQVNVVCVSQTANYIHLNFTD